MCASFRPPGSCFPTLISRRLMLASRRADQRPCKILAIRYPLSAYSQAPSYLFGFQTKGLNYTERPLFAGTVTSRGRSYRCYCSNKACQECGLKRVPEDGCFVRRKDVIKDRAWAPLSRTSL